MSTRSLRDVLASATPRMLVSQSIRAFELPVTLAAAIATHVFPVVVSPAMLKRAVSATILFGARAKCRRERASKGQHDPEAHVGRLQSGLRHRSVIIVARSTALCPREGSRGSTSSAQA